MNAVVERCPNCGVEHEVSHVGPCEVCGHELRYWCQRHSRDTGWLSGPECAQCARETKAQEAAARDAAARAAAAAREAARRPPPPVRPPVEHPRPPARPTPKPKPSRHREPRPMPRVDPREILPHVVTGADLALRLMGAVFVLVRTVFLWALFGAVAGAAYAYAIGDDMVWIGLFGLVNGAVVGLFLGFILAIISLLTRRSRL